ncbi:MAG: PQQ-binding-like beta-propeller repeat protein [Phototrophicaceae bacterium]
MNRLKFPKLSRLPVALLALVLLITGCTGARIGVSWADLELIEDRNILVSYNDFMVLIDPTNGVPVQLRGPDGQIRTDEQGNPRRWEISGGDTSSQFFTTPIWLSEERLLVVDYNRKLMHINFPNARIENPAVSDLPGQVFANMSQFDGRVFVPISEKNVVAIDTDTYETLWEFETDRGVWSEPVVADDLVVFTSIDQYMYAVDAFSGAERWRLDLGGAVASAPLLVEDRLFIGSFARKLFEVSLTGQILNEYETENWVWSTPVLFEGLLYVTDMQGFVYALDPENGLAEVWKTDTGDDSGIRPRPLVTEQYVVVGTRAGQVIWLDRQTGEVQFTQSVDAEILSDILLVQPSESLNIPDPLVIISTVKNDKILVAFTLDGAPRWTYGR